MSLSMAEAGTGTSWTRWCVVLGLTALAACNARQGGQSSQVVAKVNGSEITVSQLSAALQSMGEFTETPTPEQTQRAIDALIDEQLLYDQALKADLDRDPAVVQALERARRQVLARAFAERMVFPREPITAAEQIEYYRKHPELFEKRRVYYVTTFAVRESDLGDVVRRQLDEVASVDDVRNVLAAHGISYDVQTQTRAAEQLPLEVVSGFARAKVGDLVILPSQEGMVSMMFINAIHDSPIDLERAQPIIQQYLVNRRNSQAMREYLEQARAAADIEYYTHVADAGTTRSPGPAQTAPAGAGVSTPTETAPVSQRTPGVGDATTALDRGLP